MNRNRFNIRSDLLFVLLFSAFLFLYGCISFAPPDKKIVTIYGSGGTNTNIFVEIADEPAEISKGLMFRELLAPDGGMLFLMNRDDFHPFWMKNTKIPLEAVHIATNGTIVDILEMEPCKSDPCKIYNPKFKSRYVLEVNANLSKMKGFQIGDYLVIGDII